MEGPITPVYVGEDMELLQTHTEAKITIAALIQHGGHGSMYEIFVNEKRYALKVVSALILLFPLS